MHGWTCAGLASTDGATSATPANEVDPLLRSAFGGVMTSRPEMGRYVVVVVAVDNLSRSEGSVGSCAQ
jgi:hypothetical protein